jgi:hypothetical protein
MGPDPAGRRITHFLSPQYVELLYFFIHRQTRKRRVAMRSLFLVYGVIYFVLHPLIKQSAT